MNIFLALNWITVPKKSYSCEFISCDKFWWNFIWVRTVTRKINFIVFIYAFMSWSDVVCRGQLTAEIWESSQRGNDLMTLRKFMWKSTICCITSLKCLFKRCFRHWEKWWIHCINSGNLFGRKQQWLDHNVSLHLFYW